LLIILHTAESGPLKISIDFNSGYLFSKDPILNSTKDLRQQVAGRPYKFGKKIAFTTNIKKS
jgi:hypothetical protein